MGVFVDAKSLSHGFALKSGKYTTLNVPKAVITEAAGINNQGTIVLYWENSNHAFESSLYNGSTYTTIDVPGATNTQAWDIDNNGDVVYQWSDAKGTHGALRQQGKYYKFDDPHGVGATYGFGINDHSQIVGSYVASGFRGFESTY